MSLKAITRSDSSFTRTGGQSFSGSSSARSAGIQYCRNISPIGVPGPVWVSRSLTSCFSIAVAVPSLVTLEPFCSRRGAAHEQAGEERPPGHFDVGDARRREGVQVVLDAGERVVVVVLRPVGRDAELLTCCPQPLVPHF